MARGESPEAYRDAVRAAKASGVNLTAVAEQVGVSYFALWSAGSTS
jgi:hypothetical protein